MVETFYYGNRLKATIQYFEKENVYVVKRITYGQKEYSKDVFDTYPKALEYARHWLNTCKY